MTPLQLARAECANYEPNGACLGVMLGSRGHITHCTPQPRCVLSAGARCTYFEECVAPMQRMVTEPRRAKAIQEAVGLYRLAHAELIVTGRKCPDCRGPLAKFRQVCPGCAAKRRKATLRDAQSRRRGNGPALSTEVPKTPPNSLGNSHGFSGVSPNPYQDSTPPQNDPFGGSTGHPERVEVES